MATIIGARDGVEVKEICLGERSLLQIRDMSSDKHIQVNADQAVNLIGLLAVGVNSISQGEDKR